MKKSILALSAIASLAFFSCSSDDDNNGGNTTPPVNVISVTGSITGTETWKLYINI